MSDNTAVCNNKTKTLKLKLISSSHNFCRILYAAVDFPENPNCLVLFGSNKSVIIDAQSADIPKGEIHATLLFLSTISLFSSSTDSITAMSGNILYKAYVDINASSCDKDITDKQIMTNIEK